MYVYVHHEGTYVLLKLYFFSSIVIHFNDQVFETYLGM
jgi:hypothetical protein